MIAMRFISVKQADPLISDVLNIGDAYASFRWIVWTQRPPPLNYNSAFADHLFDTNHSPASSNPLALHFIPKSRKLDMLESVEIKKALHYNLYNILNNQLDIKNSPIIDILINDI